MMDFDVAARKDIDVPSGMRPRSDQFRTGIVLIGDGVDVVAGGVVDAVDVAGVLCRKKHARQKGEHHDGNQKLYHYE